MIRRVLLIIMTLLAFLVAESIAPAAGSELVSLSVSNAEITDVIKALAAESEADFLVAEGVYGEIPFLALHELPVEAVLDVIVRALPQLAWRRSLGSRPVYEIVEAGEIELYRLRYSSLQDAGGTLGFFVPQPSAGLYNPLAPTTSTQTPQNRTGQTPGNLL